MEMEIEQILIALERNEHRTFPREALEAAIAQREAITPKLLEVLDDATANINRLYKDSAYILPIYALFLLAQFRETQAYPKIIDFFSIPGEITLDVTGDVVTGDLGRIVASVYDGNLKPIQQVIENSEINQFVRSALLTALVVLANQNSIARETVTEYFEQLFSILERDAMDVWIGLLIESSKIGPTEKLLEHMQWALDEELVETFFFHPKDLEACRQRSVEECVDALRHDRHYQFIDDTLAEMQGWYCFQPIDTMPIVKLPSTRPIALKEELQSKQGTKAVGGNPHKTKSKRKTQQQKASRKRNRTKKNK